MSKHNDSDGSARRTVLKALGISGVALAGASAPGAAHPHGEDKKKGKPESETQGESGEDEQAQQPGHGYGNWCCSCAFAPQGRRGGPGYRRGYPHERDETEWDEWEPGDGKPPWAGEDGEDDEDEEEEEEDEEESDEDGAEDPEEPPEEDDGSDEDGDDAEEPEEDEDDAPEEPPDEDDGEPTEDPDPETPEEPEDGADEEDSEEQDVSAQIEDRVHALVNEYREAQGEEPLEFDDDLAEVAREHSEDMAEEGYFSHESPDGEGPGDRLDEAEIDCYAWAENIAWESSSAVQEEDAESVANSTASGWINSPGHRENILGAYDSEGIGVFVDDGEVFVTQVFCSDN